MGYVYQAGDLGRWYVGLQAFTVGSSFLANRDFVAQSHAYMRRLMEQSGETANLAILDGTEAVFIDQVQCRETMRTIVKLGSRVPLHASGVGKAIFASLPDEQIDAILKVKGLPRITENTITSPETMWASIRVIRQRGWSFDDEEHLPGTRCVAAPIYDEHAEPLGAISLAGPVVAPARRADQAARPGRRRTSPRRSRTGSAGAGRIPIRIARKTAARAPCRRAIVRTPELSGGGDAAVDGDDLAGDECTGIRREQRDDALQVLGPPDPPQGRAIDDIVAHRRDHALGHLRRKEARARSR